MSEKNPLKGMRIPTFDDIARRVVKDMFYHDRLDGRRVEIDLSDADDRVVLEDAIARALKDTIGRHFVALLQRASERAMEQVITTMKDDSLTLKKHEARQRRILKEQAVADGEAILRLAEQDDVDQALRSIEKGLQGGAQ
jgi:hypothetical protein